MRIILQFNSLGPAKKMRTKETKLKYPQKIQQGQKIKNCSKPNLQWRRNGPSWTILRAVFENELGIPWDDHLVGATYPEKSWSE